MSPNFYRYADDRWWFIDNGVEYWMFDDEEGIRIVENPFWKQQVPMQEHEDLAAMSFRCRGDRSTLTTI